MILIKAKTHVLASTFLVAAVSLQVATANIASKTQARSSLFNVVHVTESDNLNIRSGAGVGNEIVTTIPFDGSQIELLGDETTLGKTRWVLIKWKGITGWVSKYYLDADKTVEVVEVATTVTTKENESIAIKKQRVVAEDKVEVDSFTVEDESGKNASENGTAEITAQPKKPMPAVAVAKIQEEWVLRCGNKTPYWKVDVHPKWMDVLKGDYETGLPITKKKQDRNRWNTAIKTVVHGTNGRNKLQMTIKYAYAKRCYDTLSGLRVPYKVFTKFNGEELTGCCRAVKVAVQEKDNQTKVSMK